MEQGRIVSAVHSADSLANLGNDTQSVLTRRVRNVTDIQAPKTSLAARLITCG